MSACRSADKRPLAPLIDFLFGSTVPEIKRIMVEVMPILSAPNKRKAELIDQLVDFVRSSDCLIDVWSSAFKKSSQTCVRMILRQYDPKASQKMPKSAMIDRCIQLNESRRDDGPCLAIVPYAAGAADFSNLIVDFEKRQSKMKKTKRKLMKKWTKGARLLCRKFLYQKRSSTN